MTDDPDTTEVRWLAHMLVLGMVGGAHRPLLPRTHRR